MKLLLIVFSFYTLLSPSGALKLEVEDGNGSLKYAVYADGKQIVAPSGLSMTLADGTVLGGKVRSVSRTSSNRVLHPVVYKKSEVVENYNSMTLALKNCKVEWRAYDDGVAYRFVVKSGKPYKVKSEEAAFNFPEDFDMHVAYVRKNTGSLEEQYFSSQESMYSNSKISEWNKDRIAFPPALVDEGEWKVCISESDLRHYPGMYLYNGDGSLSLKARFPRCPSEVQQGGHNMLQGLVKSRADYLSDFPSGVNTFPWRVVSIVRSETQLAQSDLIWLLASPEEAGRDWSWLRPGKVAWDWWNDWNIRGVDFVGGINDRTYEYYIDFAASNGIEYVILDEGWSVKKLADLRQVVPSIDLPHLVSYAAERGVGIVLWAGYWALNRDIESLCRYFSELGIKGFKVDFMDRDDVQMVDFYENVARAAADNHLFVDFHGAFKPTGLNRTWPNVLNIEGVYGLENLKSDIAPEPYLQYDVTIPFIRMFAGPMDYTPGAMRNGGIANFRGIKHEPMSAGTRCRQLAEYVVFDQPFAMLCDSPSNYMEEPECTEFIAGVPTTWDKTVCVDGQIAGYVVMAREKDGLWYVGALTGVDERNLTIDLRSFLPEGQYEMTAFRDGVNAHRSGTDYRKYTERISICAAESTDESGKLNIHLAPGGGWTCVLRPVDPHLDTVTPEDCL